MRNVLPLALLLAVAGCNTPARWEKPGVSVEMTATAAVECRRTATQEAFLYIPAPAVISPNRRVQWQYEQSERFSAENRLTDSCMRSKGYELVPPPKAQS
jgi:hypothetical protein